MAGGAPIDYSYSPSGSTIELIDLASAPQSSRPLSRISSAGTNLSWHPKLTLYRLLVILSTVGLAVAKTATSYLNLTFASITLEWILGVVVFLFFHFLAAYEETRNPYFAWLFNFDYMEYFWVFLKKLGGFRPNYLSDEIDPRHQTSGIQPTVTGYRIIVTVLVASVGMTKSALLYGQEAIEATTVECIFGVGIVTGLYWLGLYEASSTRKYPKLFHVDYSRGLWYVRETLIVFLHLLALLLCSAVSYGFYLLTAMFLSPKSPARVKMGTIEYVVMSAFMGSSTSILVLGGALGAFAVMYHLGLRYLATPLGQFIAGLPGIRRIPYVYRTYWLPSAISLRPRPRLFYLKRFITRQSIKILRNLYALYGVTIVLIYCVTFSAGWYSFLMSLLEQAAAWYWLLIYFLVSLFVVPGILMVIAAVIYLACEGFIFCIFEAWKDLTVDVELLDLPV